RFPESEDAKISYGFYAGLCRLVQASKAIPSDPMGITQGLRKKLLARRNFLQAFARLAPYQITALLRQRATQRLRASTTPSRNATNKLCSGACRVTARSLAIGCPGRSAFAITSRKRSTATLSAAVTSSIVRDTSVAVSSARSAMLGDAICGVSSFTLGAFPCEGRRGRHLWLSARTLVFSN